MCDENLAKRRGESQNSEIQPSCLFDCLVKLSECGVELEEPGSLAPFYHYYLKNILKNIEFREKTFSRKFKVK